AICAIRFAASPLVPLTIVPMRMDFTGLLIICTSCCDCYALMQTCTFNRANHHRQTVDIVDGRGFGHRSVMDCMQKRRDNTRVTMCFLFVYGFRNVYGIKAL